MIISHHHYILILAMLISTPVALAGDLSSTNYTITSPRIGETSNNTLSSSNYTITPQSGEDSIDSTPMAGSRGRRSRLATSTTESSAGADVVTTLPVTESLFIAGQDREPRLLGGELGGEKVVPAKSGANQMPELFKEMNAADKVGRRMPASAISGYAEVLLEDRYVRIAVLFFVLGALLYLRSFTRFGRKYRPF